MDNTLLKPLNTKLSQTLKIALRDPLIKNFLSSNKNLYLFTKFINNPNKKDYEQLNKNFKEFYVEIRIIQYLSKTIYFSAINYAKKNHKYKKHNILTMDSNPFHYSNLKSYNPDMSELILYKKSDLLDYFEDKKLYYAIKQLTNNQKKILQFYFINELDIKKISQILDVSSQYIYKTLKNSLKKIKNNINPKKGDNYE